ncbi:hypothetical protein [Streptomyces sp. NPDC002088]|uniref:hypothetical protein n=1 Tax=Streptomyces sp. NPDC002088 TaxID=3154665 RepID=UPI00332BF23D
MPVPIRRLVVALTLCCALLAGATAYAGGGNSAQGTVAVAAAARPTVPASPSPTPTTERQRLAKTRFVANASLAAGAVYQWIVKPWRAGKFEQGAKGRRLALVKAAAAGGFAYNRLKAAARNAEGDPALSRAITPLLEGIEGLRNLPAKLRSGESTDSVAGAFDDIINQVKGAGRIAGAPVSTQVPSAGQMSIG